MFFEYKFAQKINSVLFFLTRKFIVVAASQCCNDALVNKRKVFYALTYINHHHITSPSSIRHGLLPAYPDVSFREIKRSTSAKAAVWALPQRPALLCVIAYDDAYQCYEEMRAMCRRSMYTEIHNWPKAFCAQTSGVFSWLGVLFWFGARCLEFFF